MSFSVFNDYVDGRRQLIVDDGNGIKCARFTLTLNASDVAANSIGAIGFLPADHVPVGLLIDSD